MAERHVIKLHYQVIPDLTDYLERMGIIYIVYPSTDSPYLYILECDDTPDKKSVALSGIGLQHREGDWNTVRSAVVFRK